MDMHKNLHRGIEYLYGYIQRIYLMMPYRLSARVRRFVAAYVWIIASAAGIIQLLFAMAFLDAGRKAEEAAQATTYLSRVYGAPTTVAPTDFFFYATVVALCVVGVLILVAVPGLRRHHRQRGWNVLFCALLFHILYGVCRTFSAIDGGVLHGIVALLISVSGMFVLFEILPYFPAKTTQKEDAG